MSVDAYIPTNEGSPWNFVDWVNSRNLPEDFMGLSGQLGGISGTNIVIEKRSENGVVNVWLSQSIEEGFAGPYTYIRRVVGMGMMGFELAVSANMEGPYFVQRGLLRYIGLGRKEAHKGAISFLIFGSQGITHEPQVNVNLVIGDTDTVEFCGEEVKDMSDPRVQNARRLILLLYGVDILEVNTKTGALAVRDIDDIKKDFSDLIALARSYEPNSSTSVREV